MDCPGRFPALPSSFLGGDRTERFSFGADGSYSVCAHASYVVAKGYSSHSLPPWA